MAIGTPPPTDVKEYGDKKQEEQDAEALAATAQMEAETTPQVEVPTAQAATQQPAPEQAEPPAAATAQQRVRPQNLMQIVPPELLFKDKVKNPASQDRDLALLYEAIASSPYASGLTKAILDRLRG